MLSKLEDQILMAVWRFQGKAYGVNVYQDLQERSESAPAVGVVYANLDRLSRKGYLQSSLGEPTKIRGGMRKTYYRITPQGMKVLAESMETYDRLVDEFNSIAALEVTASEGT